MEGQKVQTALLSLFVAPSIPSLHYRLGHVELRRNLTPSTSARGPKRKLGRTEHDSGYGFGSTIHVWSDEGCQSSPFITKELRSKSLSDELLRTVQKIDRTKVVRDIRAH